MTATKDNCVPSDFESKIKELIVWYKENPKLPEEIEPILLARFLKTANCEVAEAKKIIELHYDMRNKHPQLFMERDPQDEQFRATRNIHWAASLAGLTPEGYKVFFHRLSVADISMYNNYMELKCVHALFDTRFTMPDEHNNPAECGDVTVGDVQIVDMKNITFRHMLRQSGSANLINNKLMFKAFPTREKAIHLLNPPGSLKFFMCLFRPFMPSDIKKHVYIHHDLESLYKYIPKDMLPEEYGGKAGKLEDLNKYWTQLMLDKRDYLTNPKYWKAKKHPESKSRCCC